MNTELKFEWDEAKRQANIEKHGLDFVDAGVLFNSEGAPFLVSLDVREEYGEERWIGLGLLSNRVVVVVYTEPDENTRRIISFRKAVSYEREEYEEYLADELGES